MERDVIVTPEFPHVGFVKNDVVFFAPTDGQPLHRTPPLVQKTSSASNRRTVLFDEGEDLFFWFRVGA